jgi:hypothetical protein
MLDMVTSGTDVSSKAADRAAACAACDRESGGEDIKGDAFRG